MNPRNGPGRRAAAVVLTAVDIVAMPAAITAAWIRGTVLSTSGYVAAVAPLAADRTRDMARRGSRPGSSR